MTVRASSSLAKRARGEKTFDTISFKRSGTCLDREPHYRETPLRKYNPTAKSDLIIKFLTPCIAPTRIAPCMYLQP